MPATFTPQILFDMKFPVGSHVGKKKPSSQSPFANKHGRIIGFGEKHVKRGRRQTFYIVELSDSGKVEEWTPSVTYLLDSNFGTDNVAFT